MTQSAKENSALGAAALASAAQEVLGAAWGCVPDDGSANASADAPANTSGSALPSAAWYGSALPLSVDGLRQELQLQTTVGVVAGLLPRMLGRAASAEEVDEMAEELVAELVNQVAGHLAGLLGEDGMEVELGIPTWLPIGTNLSTTPISGEGPRAEAVVRWTLDGNPLVLSLSCAAASLS